LHCTGSLAGSNDDHQGRLCNLGYFGGQKLEFLQASFSFFSLLLLTIAGTATDQPVQQNQYYFHFTAWYDCSARSPSSDIDDDNQGRLWWDNHCLIALYFSDADPLLFLPTGTSWSNIWWPHTQWPGWWPRMPVARRQGLREGGRSRPHPASAEGPPPAPLPRGPVRESGWGWGPL